MSRWISSLAAAALVFIAGCGGPAAQPTTAPTSVPATAVPTPTAAPTASEAATGTPQATPTAAPVASATAAPAAGLDFVPAARSVWNTAVGLDNMSGTCAKGSLLPVYGLVQITPDGDRLNWKNQEPAPYVFGKLQTNLYQYAGPSAIKDGVVTMTVTFLSEKDLEMKREFVANADPACLHTHVYTGTFQWAK